MPAAPTQQPAPRPTRADRERGQTLVVMAIFMVVLMSFVAVVIDGGMFFMQRRSIQGDADAAAMAAVRDLAASQTQASTTAEQYVESHNHDDATLEAVNITENGTKIQVVVTTTGDSNFNQLLGNAPPTIRARATAKLQMMGPAAGMLPMAFMRDSFAVGVNTNVKFDGTAGGNRGPIAPDVEPPCNPAAGAADFRNLIKGSDFGGVDACAMAIGDVTDTETGNMSGPARQGFDSRIGANGDTFSDVFELDASTGLYSVKLPHSPRLGIVPVIEQVNGSNAWPAGKKPIRILSYMLVYIGKTDAGNVPYTNNGKDVWVTPVRAILPEDFSKFDDSSYVDFDASSNAPVVYRLVA